MFLTQNQKTHCFCHGFTPNAFPSSEARSALELGTTSWPAPAVSSSILAISAGVPNVSLLGDLGTEKNYSRKVHYSAVETAVETAVAIAVATAVETAVRSCHDSKSTLLICPKIAHFYSRSLRS